MADDILYGVTTTGGPATVGQHVGPHERRMSCEDYPRCRPFEAETGMLMIGPDDDAYHIAQGRHTREPHPKTAGCTVAPECHPAGITQPGPHIDDDAVAGVGAPADVVENPVADIIQSPARTAAYRPPPEHYSTGRGIQPWDVWDAFDLDRYTANATKYLLRAGKKPGEDRVKDLKKALDYVQKAIERAELESE